MPLVPWHRWGRRAYLVPIVFCFVIYGPGVGLLANALTYYVALFILPFTFVGLSQPPWTSLKLAPAALVLGSTGLVPLDEPVRLLVPLFFTVGAGVLVGEVLAAQVSRLRSLRRSVDDLVTGITGLTGAEHLTDAATRAATAAAGLLRADVVLVLLPEEGTPGRYRYFGGHGAAVGLDEVVVDTSVEPSGVVLAAEHGRPVFIPDAPGSPHIGRSNIDRFGHASVLYVPLLSEQGFVGVLTAIWCTPRRSIGRRTLRAVLLLAAEAGKQVERLRRTALLAHEAETDALTGLPNRRAFFRELAVLAPEDAVLFLDLDHFKDLNDRLGHQEGDEELAAFAATLAECIRETDCPARYGGEEFGVIVRGEGVRGVEVLVDRLRVAWKARGRTTFSAGAAIHRSGSPSDTLAAADRALYDAKDSGRNRLCWSMEEAYAPDDEQGADAPAG
jgi:diguanylate cyclase (GGDEF)-like protein